MNNFTEKLFFILTWLAQGPSFLEPAAYALMHRKHHRLSDTEGDPHSPVKFSNWFKFMLKTFDEYRSFKNDVAKNNYEDKNLPRWPKFENIVDTYTVRILFALSYVLFYVYFAPNILFFLLVPIHIAMGPIHGFIVNWFGHKHGYRNFKMLGDNSKNTLHIDFLMMGELYQNNHHRYPQKMNFAVKWFEVDFGFYIVKILHFLRIITIK
jgi:stearoyl-CoA desaturase (delta-9 desaturase)